jgi:hypothetical protein
MSEVSCAFRRVKRATCNASRIGFAWEGRTRSLVAAQIAPHADCRVYLLSVWKGYVLRYREAKREGSHTGVASLLTPGHTGQTAV